MKAVSLNNLFFYLLVSNVEKSIIVFIYFEGAGGFKISHVEIEFLSRNTFTQLSSYYVKRILSGILDMQYWSQI